MQISQRFMRDRRGLFGRARNELLSTFHASLLEVLPFAAAYVGRDGRILAHNPLLADACAQAGVKSVPSNLRKLFSGDSWGRCERVLTTAFGGQPVEAGGAFAVPSGQVLCRHLSCTPQLFLKRDCSAVLLQFENDVTGRQECGLEPELDPEERALVRSALLAGQSSSGARARHILEHFPDDILVFEGQTHLEDIAARLRLATGCTCESSILETVLDALDAGAPQTLHLALAGPADGTFGPGGPKVCEVRFVALPETADGEEGKASAAPRGFMAVIRRDVDSPKEVAENRKLAYKDPLTGLENRRAFTRYLKGELARMASDRQTGLAVYYIDLDEFKKVNDLGGHDAGDDMLLRVAACLRQALGEFGTVARIGGDEFAAMLPVASEAAALDFANRILKGFERIRLEIMERVFTISGSVGVAFVDGSVVLNNADASALLGLADRACLRGKRTGGQSVQVHGVQAGDWPSQIHDQPAAPEPESFCGKDLTLYAMPVVALKSGTVCGVEVLLRLIGDRARGLSARAWISAAERSGFIAQVDGWTLDRVLDAVQSNATRMLVTMNVSADTARDPNFRDALFHRLSVNPLLASRLCLEIAEKDFLREPAMVESFFTFVSDLGCQTSIDDFAGHWPVLSRLTGSRVEWLKLEAGLTREALNDPSKAVVLNGLVRAARELGIKVIAKHVETEQDAERLRILEIDAAQGFHFGKPAPWPNPGGV